MPSQILSEHTVPNVAGTLVPFPAPGGIAYRSVVTCGFSSAACQSVVGETASVTVSYDRRGARVRETLRPMSVGIGAAALLAALVIAANIWPRGSTVEMPPASSAPGSGALGGGPISDLIRHSWQRPIPVTPGMDRWASGFLSLASGPLDYGPEPGPAASRSAVAVTDVDTLEVTATVETQECAIGDIGAYRWSVEGKDTVMTLTAISPDACPTREKALAGVWVRSDLPVALDGGPTLSAGTYLTSAFDPFDRPGISGQLSYTVPEGWKTEEDEAASFTLHHLSDASAGQPPTDSLIALIAQPRMAADFENGAPCGPFSDAPGVGLGVHDIVAAIRARAGVVSTAPAAMNIGGYKGQMLDLHLAPSWTGGCQAPEGVAVGIPILHVAGPGPGLSAGIDPDHPLRLILLDLTGGRTLAIGIFNIEPSQASAFEEQVAVLMPIIESFRFK
jgi:hypothetical protein